MSDKYFDNQSILLDFNFSYSIINVAGCFGRILSRSKIWVKSG